MGALGAHNETKMNILGFLLKSATSLCTPSDTIMEEVLRNSMRGVALQSEITSLWPSDVSDNKIEARGDNSEQTVMILLKIDSFSNHLMNAIRDSLGNTQGVLDDINQKRFLKLKIPFSLEYLAFLEDTKDISRSEKEANDRFPLILADDDRQRSFDIHLSELWPI
jgi:hypothetical protein